jgi:prevent-host-death family protein
MDHKTNPNDRRIGAYEAKTRFSELVARAEKGESFVVTKHGREVARIEPPSSSTSESARAAGQRILARLDARSRISQEEAQREWEALKADIEADRDERVDRWLKS